MLAPILVEASTDMSCLVLVRLNIYQSMSMNRDHQGLKEEDKVTTPINHSRALLVQEEDSLPWVIETPEIMSRKFTRYYYTVACCIIVKALGIELLKLLTCFFVHLLQ